MKKNDDSKKYGAITEQGDLGLGFDIFNEQDQEALKKNERKSSSDDKNNLYVG